MKKLCLLLSLLLSLYTFCAYQGESVLEPGRGITTFLSHALVIDTGSARELIHNAALDGDKAVLIRVARGDNIETKTEKGWTPLHFAVFYGHTECAAWLLEQGADVEAATGTGWRPLHFAVEKTAVNTIRLLVWHYRADINASTSAGMTPLLLAAKNEQPFVVKLLLDWGARCNEAALSGRTALHFAAIHGNLVIAQMLLKKGASVDRMLRHNQSTPVHIATKHQHTSLAEWLLEQWADTLQCFRVHPVHIASRIGLLEMVKKFISRDCTLATIRTAPGVTPMLFAARFNHAEIVVWLVDRGYVDVNEVLPEGHNALHYAAANGNLPLVMFLMQRGAAHEARTCAGCTPLYVAFVKRHAAVARYLIEQGADVDAPAMNGNTPRRMANAVGLTRVV